MDTTSRLAGLLAQPLREPAVAPAMRPPASFRLGPPGTACTLVFLLLAVVAVCLGGPRAVGAVPGGGRGGQDLASEVHAIFSAKCAQCHGANLRRPKGKFGYVLDLKRVAANPRLVVPSSSDESKLWKLIGNDKMPPRTARAGRLSPDQKATIRAWIEAGAPSASVAAAAEDEETTEPAPLPFDQHLLAWLGKFHISVIHFPIALLLAAALGELWALVRRLPVPSPAVRFCVLLGAAAAVPAAALGWLHATYGGYGSSDSQLLNLHRWFGTTTAVWAVVVALLSEADARAGIRRRRFRVALFLGALLVGLTGHLGGILAYGEDYFNW
ncbi:MAG TPA: cytochrome c [Gemmataceae bacterium]|nr:cytochrome c [Gemmataceae bacterium]